MSHFSLNCLEIAALQYVLKPLLKLLQSCTIGPKTKLRFSYNPKLTKLEHGANKRICLF